MEKRGAKYRIIRHYMNIIISCLIEDLEEELKKQKRIWTRPWLLRRDTHGASVGLLTELAIEDHQEYRQCLRMNPIQFESLLTKLSPRIQRKDTHLRPAIPAKIKLEVTLSYLATGNSYLSLSHFFRVSKSAISLLIPEVLDALYENLRDYIKVSHIVKKNFYL